MTFAELLKRAQNMKKMYGGTYEVHYTDKTFGKMVAFVEAYSEKLNGVRKAVIETAQNEQYIDPETITCIKKYA